MDREGWDANEALQATREAAEAGSLDAQLCVGYALCTHRGARRAEAARWLRKAGEQGDSGAQLQLAYMYTRGYGVPNDYAAAMEWLQRAASSGHEQAEAYLRAGSDSGGKFGQPARAVVLLREGPPPASRVAGAGAREFTGKTNDKIIERPAPPPEFFRGVTFLHEARTVADLREGLRCLCICALSGYLPAQFKLGQIYFAGEGVARDYVKAYRWFNLAGANGFEAGLKARDRVAQRMSGAQMRETLKAIAEAQALRPGA